MRIRSRMLVGAVIGIVLALAVALRLDDSRPVSDAPMASWSDGTGPRHIVAFGTSLTAGNGWPDRLAEALTACFGSPVTVTRVAAPGAGSDWALEAVPRILELAPDVVLVEFAINDADLRDGVRAAVSRTRHEALFTALTEGLPQARVVAMTMSPAYGLRGYLRPGLSRLYRQVVDIALSQNLGVIDFYPRWQALDERSLLPDGLHPTDDATRQVMDPVLLAAFANAAGRRC